MVNDRFCVVTSPSNTSNRNGKVSLSLLFAVFDGSFNLQINFSIFEKVIHD